MSTGNPVLDWMLKQPDMPLTVEKFVESNWFGQKTLFDLEGEDWCDVRDFEEKLRELLGENESEQP